MKSSFKLLVTLLFITVAPLTLALGLGEVTTESALNEPLVARIELVNADSLSNNDLIVAIGSQEDYRIARVDREFSHTDFTFEARIDGEADPYISLTSSRAIVEPFVNFVVQVRWPQGKLLREYTILIDFPVFTGATESQPVTSATTQPAPRSQVRSSAATSDTASSNIGLRTNNNAQPRRTLTTNSGEYYVQAGDTLWGVAGSVARSTGTSRNQAMLSIRDLNPDAFINGNVNSLKSGVILRVPSQQQITERSVADATREFAEVQQTGSRNIEATPVQARDTSFRNQSTSTSQNGGRLALASASALGSSTGSSAEGSENAEASGSFRDENIILKEELDKVALENADLKDRLAALEEILQLEAEALIEIENDDLALAQQVSAQVNAADLSSPEAEETVDSSIEKTSEPTVDDVASVGTPQVVQSEPTHEKSIIDTAIGFLPFIGVFFVVLLLIVFLLLKRRKSKEHDELLAPDSDPGYDMDHIDQNLSVDSSIEEEMQSTRSFVVDQDDDIEGMDTIFSEEADEIDPTEEIQAEAERESQQMEDTLANFEETTVMGSQSSDQQDELNDTGVFDIESELDSDHDKDDEDLDDEFNENSIDEFADLDSFFNDDDIEDVDPNDLVDESLDDVGEFAQVSSDDSPIEDEFTDSAEKMAFESIDIPSDSSSESISKASLDHSNSLDFEIGIDLPEPEEVDEGSLVEVDLNDSDLADRSLDFDLDDMEPILEDDDIAPLVSDEDDANSMEFDLSGVDLGGNAELNDETESYDGLDLNTEEAGGLNLPFEDENESKDGIDNALDSSDLEFIDETLDSDMDDLLDDDMDQLEIKTDSVIKGDASPEDSNFDLGEGEDLLGDLSMDTDFDSDLSEEIATKLELADAYVDMGDVRGAKELLDEILEDGDDSQKDAARLISERIEGLI